MLLLVSRVLSVSLICMRSVCQGVQRVLSAGVLARCNGGVIFDGYLIVCIIHGCASCSGSSLLIYKTRVLIAAIPMV